MTRKVIKGKRYPKIKQCTLIISSLDARVNFEEQHYLQVHQLLRRELKLGLTCQVGHRKVERMFVVEQFTLDYNQNCLFTTRCTFEFRNQ